MPEAAAAAAAAADSPGLLGERLQKAWFIRLHTVKLATEVSRDLAAAARAGRRVQCATAFALIIDLAMGAMLIALTAEMDAGPQPLHATAAEAITALCNSMVTELQRLLESLMEAPVCDVALSDPKFPPPPPFPPTHTPAPIPHTPAPIPHTQHRFAIPLA